MERTPGDMAVVVLSDALQDAYDMGYSEFADVPSEEYTSREEIYRGLDGFRQYARYSNHVLPHLRALAGYGDGGHGTYQVSRPVAVVHPADLDDRPIEAEEAQPRHLLRQITEAWDMGAVDAMKGEEPDADEAVALA